MIRLLYTEAYLGHQMSYQISYKYIYMSHAIGEFAQFDQIVQAINGSIYSCAIHRCLTKMGHYP